MVTKYTIYPSVLRLVAKSSRFIKKHDLRLLEESTALLWGSWTFLHDATLQSYAGIPGYSVSQRNVCSNSQIRPLHR
ncbi:uncharacterized protein BT62DRAFT_581185 [Guyanagaster necrorhizus]|uniref:Uncharacterized protein n=1 Tax=Guyanagaster necrorhizus TaxID=856835 RepID=A0A9P7VHA9_9AGAR|nr:uncharacterized protein BT62DRAFT_581185 [Guyanagaster necrorhizus MCA 3950]KAG7440547.1 hypothetical protein BT62DRAFT_581185 [Guyanagaster necrorhizus MCA 3950]